MSDPGTRLIMSDPPPRSATFFGSVGSTPALPTTHWPLSGALRFQLSRFLPLNGESANASAGSNSTAQPAAIRVRVMGCSLDGMKNANGNHETHERHEKGRQKSERQ